MLPTVACYASSQPALGISSALRAGRATDRGGESPPVRRLANNQRSRTNAQRDRIASVQRLDRAHRSTPLASASPIRLSSNPTRQTTATAQTRGRDTTPTAPAKNTDARARHSLSTGISCSERWLPARGSLSRLDKRCHWHGAGPMPSWENKRCAWHRVGPIGTFFYSIRFDRAVFTMPPTGAPRRRAAQATIRTAVPAS